MLVVTIHDVAPAHLDAVSKLRFRLANWGVTSATLLAVPNYHERGCLEACARTVNWLRARARAGDEIALHGVTHRAKGPGKCIVDRMRARMWTAGEGEMVAANAPTSGALAVARDKLARLVGAPVRGFVAPAWLEPTDLAGRLAAVGFGWHETSMTLERLNDRTRVVGPVIGFATRSSFRMRAAITWSRALTPVVGRLVSHARVALHPGDLGSSAVMTEAERVIRLLVKRYAVVTTSAALALA